MERRVWQDALDEITSFTKTPQGRSIYNRRKETIERSFAEAKVNHGLRFARMLNSALFKKFCKRDFCDEVRDIKIPEPEAVAS